MVLDLVDRMCSEVSTRAAMFFTLVEEPLARFLLVSLLPVGKMDLKVRGVLN